MQSRGWLKSAATTSSSTVAKFETDLVRSCRDCQESLASLAAAAAAAAANTTAASKRVTDAMFVYADSKWSINFSVVLSLSRYDATNFSLSDPIFMLSLF